MIHGNIPGVRYCEVISNTDPTGAGRIKVRIYPEDFSRDEEELSYAFPLLPKMFGVTPKIGEGVLVLTAVMNNNYTQRYYIGPVISQENRLYYDEYFGGADSFMNGSWIDLRPNPNMKKNVNGAFPKQEDISIEGRKNADIQITEDDVRIKAGVKLVNPNRHQVTFNKKNPAYLKLKYHETPLGGNNASTATLVADKINLLSNKSERKRTQDGRYKLTDAENLISDSELEGVINEAYKLPYGEVLVDFLKKFVKVFINHTHDYIGLPPNKADIDELKSASARPLDQGQMLSDTVRIN